MALPKHLKVGATLVTGEFGERLLIAGAPSTKPDPSWTPPGMPGWDPEHVPEGPHNAGGPYWRVF